MDTCVFCKVIQGNLPGKFAYRSDDVVVIHDIHPQAPVHLLVIPINHIPSLREVEEKDMALLGRLMLVAKEAAEKAGIAKSGYKLVANNGTAAGQLVDHLHIHVLGGWTKTEKWRV